VEVQSPAEEQVWAVVSAEEQVWAVVSAEEQVWASVQGWGLVVVIPGWKLGHNQ
jgi:hypothetical protein